MSKLPQVNVRLALEHHDLIRSIAARLRRDPDFAKSLALMLNSDSSRLDDANPWLARLEDLEARTAALEEWAVSSGAPPLPDKAEPTQPHLTLDQTRQVDAMMKAGRSAEEIMKVTGRPIPTREEIKQRLLDEISPPPAATA
jgi:hypothetical protein